MNNSNFVDTLLTVGGRSPREVARTMLALFFMCYLANRVKKRYFTNGLRYGMMQFMFTLYTTAKGKSGMKDTMNDLESQLEQSLIPAIIKEYEPNTALPLKSMDKETLISMLTDWSKHESKMWNGDEQYESGTVYHGRPSLTEVQNRAYCLFSITNPLHPNTFPFIRKMESEVIAMTLSLFHGSVLEGQCGILSSGGTESIILAIRAHKKYAMTHRHVQRPELYVIHSLN